MRFNFFLNCHYKMFNQDNIIKENNKKHNKKWPFIPDHPYKVLITGDSGSGKANPLLSLISQQDDIDKTYLYAKNLSEPKCEFLINKHENVRIKNSMIQTHLLSAQMQWMTFMRILMITTQAEKGKF